MKLINVYITIFILLATSSCKKNKENTPFYNPSAYDLKIPAGFPEMPIPVDNPLTKEGVELGKHLFFEKKLSGDNSLSCSGCHSPNKAFSDDRQFSPGIDGRVGNRQSMVIQNLGWSNSFFWDGRAQTLEEQALAPVTNPIEMHESWPNAAGKLMVDPFYRDAFYKAFGTETIDSTLITKALAQFMRTLISGDSKYDQFIRGEALLTPEEISGYDIFRDLNRGDCIHCHAENAQFTDFSFQNNGMDLTFKDNGLGDVTKRSIDNGKFKVPTLRNIEFSAPYMHDGRFNTLEEVIDFYSENVLEDSPNISPLMEHKDQGGVNLTLEEKQHLKAFLLTLSDPKFLNNPEFRNR